jgi:hypothetical protein
VNGHYFGNEPAASQAAKTLSLAFSWPCRPFPHPYFPHLIEAASPRPMNGL